MTVLDLTLASGDHGLSVRRFTAVEGISSLFRVDIQALSPDPDIDLSSILGQPASLRVVHGTAHLVDLGERVFQGIVSSIAQVRAEEKGLTAYEITLVPALALLAHRRDHRVFQHLSAPDIVQEILSDWHIAFTPRIEPEQHPTLEVCVQYGESDLDFVSRLLEAAGIAYLEGDAADPTLLLTDHPTSAPLRPGLPIPFVDNPNQASEKEYVTRVHAAREVRPGARVTRDYDFRNPGVPQAGEAKAEGFEQRLSLAEYTPGAFLIEGQKGGDTPVADGHGVARHNEPWARTSVSRALEADRTGDRSFEYATNCPDLRPGTVFVVDHPHPAISGRPLLATELRIEGSPDKEWTIEGRAVLAEVPYRPPRRTPKPRILGVQTATVTGPPGEEIHADEFGRVRVRFHWDRKAGALADRTSSWLRVSQPWAGAGFGWTALPRVGQEVLVTFFEGDPDQPVILGGAHNGAEPVPYPLPASKTASLWRSRSSPGSEGFNELFLDDARDRELFYLQAERDLSSLVRRNDTSTVARHLSRLVKGDETQTTGKDRTKIVLAKRNKLVKKDHTVRVEGHRTSSVARGVDVTVEGSSRIEIGGDSSVSIHGGERTNVGGAESRDVGGDAHEVTIGRQAIEVKGDVHLLSDDLGVIEGFVGITLKVPGAFVLIDAGGVVIKGPLVKINSGGAAGAGAGAKPESPEPPAQLDEFDPPMPYGDPNPDGDVPRPVDAPQEPPPPEPVTELTWIEIILVDADDNPVAGEKYRIFPPKGRPREGITGPDGRAREEGLVPGECQITFPDLDREEWD